MAVAGLFPSRVGWNQRSGLLALIAGRRLFAEGVERRKPLGWLGGPLLLLVFRSREELHAGVIQCERETPAAMAGPRCVVVV